MSSLGRNCFADSKNTIDILFDEKEFDFYIFSDREYGTACER